MITSFLFDWPVLRLYGFMMFFMIAGIAHLIYPKPFMATIPFLPYRKLIVILTGLLEIGLGLGMLFPSIRVILIWVTITYLLAVFPANIYMALNPERFNFSKFALYLRLPIQFLIIWWVYSLSTIPKGLMSPVLEVKMSMIRGLSSIS